MILYQRRKIILLKRKNSVHILRKNWRFLVNTFSSYTLLPKRRISKLKKKCVLKLVFLLRLLFIHYY